MRALHYNRFMADFLAGILLSAALLMTSASPRPSQAPSPTQRPILFADIKKAGAELRVVWSSMSPDGKRVIELWQGGVAALSPRGDRAVVQLGNQLLLTGPAMAMMTPVFTLPPGEEFVGYPPAWSPNDRSIAVFLHKESRYRIAIFDVDLLTVVARLPITPAVGAEDNNFFAFTNFFYWDAFAWSPDGTKMLLSVGSCCRNTVRALVMDAATGKSDPVSDVPVVAEWAPDSKAVFYLRTVQRGASGAVTPAMGELYVKRLDAPASRLLSAAQLQAIGFSQTRGLRAATITLVPDKQQLAISAISVDGKHGLVAVFPANSSDDELGVPRTFQAAEGEITGIEWSPDSRSLAVQTAFPGVHIKRLDLMTGTWTTLVDLQIPLDSIDFLGSKTLSWTR